LNKRALKRNILGVQDFAKTTDAQRFCRDAPALYARLFRRWRKFQGSLIDRNPFDPALDSAATALVGARRAVPRQ
jgi:hypothetical protein